ncbi:MAG: hypothetical protein ACK55I_22410, partial [bacterium]
GLGEQRQGGLHGGERRGEGGQHLLAHLVSNRSALSSDFAGCRLERGLNESKGGAIALLAIQPARIDHFEHHQGEGGDTHHPTGCQRLIREHLAE